MLVPSAASVRVLFVGTAATEGHLIVDMLGVSPQGPFEVETVEIVEHAADRLRAAPHDVVLLDVAGRDRAPLETFGRVQRAAADVPIVVIADAADERSALEAVRAGAQDYLLWSRIDGDLVGRVLRNALERKRADQRIRVLSLAVDQSPAAVFLTDPRGVIEYVNERFSVITGYTADEAIGRKPSILKSGLTSLEVYRDLWRTILHGQPWRGEIRNRRKDGSLYWDEARVSPIHDADGRITHFLALQEDISDRRAMVEALKDREERFRQVTEAIREAYFLTAADLSEMLYVSPAYEQIWGVSSDSLYREPASFIDPVLPEDRQALFAHIDRIRAGGEPEQCEYRLRRPDGEIRWIVAHTGGVRNELGEVYRLAGVAADITLRKNAEQALRSSEQRLRTLFETVKLIVLALDADGRVEYVNPFLLSLTGYTPFEAVGSDWFARFVPDSHQPEVGRVFRELIEQDIHTHYTSPIVTRGGKQKVISWHNTVVRDADGRPTGTLSVGEDITERETLEAQFRQSQKMEAVGRLAGGVAHDFNNLLTVILGMTELLLAETEPGQQHTDLDEIRAAAERAAGLTRQLLAFSRQQVLAPRVIELNTLVADLERMLRRVIGEDLALHTLLASDTGAVLADAGQIEQVIMNLAINSRDAMPTGGSVTIETSNAELDEAYAADHIPVRPGSYVMLAISDTGTGMDAATRSQIFEPFFTTKPKGKGTGLGLSTVYGIVKQSGGHIWVYSEPGLGTTFKVYLPRVQARAHAVPAGTQIESLAGTETVLVAEDEGNVRALMCKVLLKYGYRVLDADGGGAALELARQHSGDIALLITDVVMPEMSGRELADRIERMRPGMQVLFVSGYTDEAIVHHGILADGVHFLQKPYTPDALARKVRQLINSQADTGASPDQ